MRWSAARGAGAARPGSTTLSRSSGETSTQAEGQLRRLAILTMAVAAVGVVVLGGAADGGSGASGRSSPRDRQPAAAIVQPSGVPEPSVKPPRLAAPEGGLPAPQVGPAVAPPSPVPEERPPPRRPRLQPRLAPPSEPSPPVPAHEAAGERSHRFTNVSQNTIHPETGDEKDASKRLRPSTSLRAPEARRKPPAAALTVIKREVF